VAAGQLVPVALDGAHLPGGVKIKKGKLRGMISEGMICSGEELHVPTELYPNIEEKGILVFQEDYPLGADVKPILGIDDTAVDFEILANRPDCLCAIGIARETAAALERRGLLANAGMVADCGLETEQVYTDLRQLPEEISYFATIVAD